MENSATKDDGYVGHLFMETKGILLQEQITSARDHPTPDKEEVTNCGNQPNFRKVSLVLITTQI